MNREGLGAGGDPGQLGGDPGQLRGDPGHLYQMFQVIGSNYLHAVKVLFWRNMFTPWRGILD